MNTTDIHDKPTIIPFDLTQENALTIIGLELEKDCNSIGMTKPHTVTFDQVSVLIHVLSTHTMRKTTQYVN